MALLESITLVGYVDDTATIIVASDLNTAQIKTEIMIRRDARWMGKQTPTSSREDRYGDTVWETNRNECTDTGRRSSDRNETLRRVPWGNDRHETDVR